MDLKEFLKDYETFENIYITTYIDVFKMAVFFDASNIIEAIKIKFNFVFWAFLTLKK